MLKFGNNANKNKQRRVSIQDPSEGTPLILPGGSTEEGVALAAAAAAVGREADDDDSNSEDPNISLGEVMFEGLKDSERRESIAADKLSMRLLEIDDQIKENIWYCLKFSPLNI